MAIYKLNEEQDGALFANETPLDNMFQDWLAETGGSIPLIMGVVHTDVVDIYVENYHKFIKSRFNVTIVESDDSLECELHGEPEDITYLLLHL